MASNAAFFDGHAGLLKFPQIMLKQYWSPTNDGAAAGELVMQTGTY